MLSSGQRLFAIDAATKVQRRNLRMDKKIFDILFSAMVECMLVVSSYQLGERKLKKRAKVKAHDKTLLTQADLDSGKAALTILLELPEDYDITPEDSKGRTTPGARYIVWLDNIDGTRSFTNGLKTSTVILAIYDRKLKKVIFCMIGEPVSGEIRHATEPTASGKAPAVYLTRIDFASGNITRAKKIKVNRDTLNNQATVFVDYLNLQPFMRKMPNGGKQQILSADAYKRLVCNLIDLGIYLAMPGSNGLHQAMVANGWEKCVAGMTLAMGGEWDVAGVLLVLMAGGSARGFRVKDNTIVKEGDPLDPFSYDVLFYGNSLRAVDMLIDAFYRSIN
jgi:fructose-1,6-bisphosphatase/inositol monophosphatase family enzyme